MGLSSFVRGQNSPAYWTAALKRFPKLPGRSSRMRISSESDLARLVNGIID